MDNGVKVFHLIAEPIQREFAPGMIVNCWGYNGSTPGPTLEAVEGDRVRILVTNRLPEHTTIHWHGIFLPNGMDGVGGLTQPHIKPGETYVYEFTLRQHGSFMYHPHADEMVQAAMGMMGMFIIHPKVPREPHVDRDFCFMLHAWDIDPGTYIAKPDDDRVQHVDFQQSRIPGHRSVGGTKRRSRPHPHRQHEHARSSDPHTRLRIHGH
jgi:FtsP/CotA-like multicopper oxidase with cupredoxin domain